MKKLILGLLALMLVTTPAFAIIHLEPFVGYATGEEDTNDANPDSYSGMGYGARVGMSFTGVIFGASYEAIGITSEQSSGSEFDFDMTHMGAFLGYEFPLGLRVLATFHASATAEYGGLSGTAGTLLNGAEVSGSGYSLGLGYSPIPMLAFNIEYKAISYDELELPSGTKLTLNNSGTSLWFLSVSAPLGF